MPLPPISGKTNSDDRGEGRALQSMVICLNWLHLGSPSRVPADYEPLAAMTGEQRGVLQRLKRLSSCWLDCPMISAADMGRTAGKVESLQDSLARLTSSAAAILKSFDYRTNVKKPPENKEQPAPSSQTMVAEVQLAKEVEADRLSFGGRPCFHPSQLLNQRARQIFDAPLDHSLHPSESPDAPPRAHVRGARNELIKLLHKLDDTGRLALFGPHQVRLGHRAGVFCLIKNQQQDRLILDSRGANLLEEGLVDWTQTMASPMPLLDIILQEGEHLEASGEDLRDYYYLYAVSEQRAARNSIALNLTPAEAKKFKSSSSAPAGCPFYVPALRTLAMGDINAVEYGQQSHMMLALQAGFKMDEICTMHGKCPRHRWFAGIIIDDFVLVEKVVTASPGAKVSAELADMMVDSYLSHGLQPHEKKRFREQTDAKFWGAQISGTKGLIRAQLERTVPICHITAQLCRLGVSNRKLLEVLAGSWISILQFRRRGMCLLAEVFDVIQAHDYMETFPLPPALVDELWSLVLLAPTFCTDLRTQPVAELSLVDASGSHRAEVTAPIPRKLAEELVRHKLTKAAWSRLLSPFRAWQRLRGVLAPEDEVPAGEAPSQAHPVWTQLSHSLQFKIQTRKAIKQKTHINISELRAALECEARVGRSKPSCRPLIGSDSQVSLGALIKGRSSSRSLNGLLRRFFPSVLGYSIFSCWQYIGTKDNVADDPTRYLDCRPPCSDLPEWFDSAATGDFSAFDKFLQQQDLDDATMAKLPELHEVVQFVPEPANLRELRRRAWFAGRARRTGSEKTVLTKPPVATPTRRAEPWLDSRALSASALALLQQVPTSQFVVPTGKKLEDVLHKPGHIDLFSGCRIAAKKLAECSGRWVLCYDLKHSPTEDLLDLKVQRFLEQCVDAGAFLTATAGPVCSSFSRAVCPPVRSALQPTGVDSMTDSMREKVAIGNAMATWLASFISRCLDAGLKVWVENPSGSYLWLHPAWVRIIRKYSLNYFQTDYCRWGTPWRKRTKFYGNFWDGVEKLSCSCSRKHIQLRGYSHQFRMSWTKAAESYPARSAVYYLAARLVESLKPIQRQRRLDAAACARSSSRRIGEATNPGPRQRQPRSDLPDLERINLVQPATQLLQQRVHSRFVAWLESELGSEVLDRFSVDPSLQVHFVRAFGNWLYQTGEPMYLFRHLVVYLQQRFPSSRGALTSSWELLARWEIALPVIIIGRPCRSLSSTLLQLWD